MSFSEPQGHEEEIQLFIWMTGAAGSVISIMNSEQYDRMKDEDVPLDVHSPGAHVGPFGWSQVVKA